MEPSGEIIETTKDFPKVSCDGVFQYNQPLTWFNMPTGELIARFLETIGLDLFFPQSFEYEFVAYAFNCIDFTISHPYSKVRGFNTARVANLVSQTAAGAKLGDEFVLRLDYVTEQWDTAREAWVGTLDRLRRAIRRHDERNGTDDGQDGDPEGGGNCEEQIRNCCVATGHAIGELLVNLVVATLYISYVSRLHLANLIHDNYILLRLEQVFKDGGENLDAWYVGVKQRIFDMRSTTELLQIGGKLKKADFVDEYFRTDDDKARADIVNRNGALTHEDYYLGDFLMDIIFFLWKQYQTCFVDDDVYSDLANLGPEEQMDGVNCDVPPWLPRPIGLALCRRAGYFKAPPENAPENATNEKNIISFLNQINKN